MDPGCTIARTASGNPLGYHRFVQTGAAILLLFVQFISACGYDPTGGTEDITPGLTPTLSTTTPGDDDTTESSPAPDPSTEEPSPSPCPDADGDGSCDEWDCDDANALTYPGADEQCDTQDNNCDGSVSGSEYDRDGDGFSQCSGDCADSDLNVFPGAPERCNGLNDDCIDDIPANETTDGDRDGYYACEDCNDSDATVNIDGTEVCDNVDNDCDGSVDEYTTYTFYVDSDGDNYGQASSAIEACSLEQGYSSHSGDCDDAQTTVYPNAVEICDSQDNNCNGDIDEGLNIPYYGDSDGDGYGSDAHIIVTCEPQAGYSDIAGDCDDNDATINPSATEVCDGADSNCDGIIDDEELQDADQDGSLACSDCSDQNATVYPGATEVCNGADDDCDGVADVEGSEGTGDIDGDGIIDCLDQNCPTWVQDNASNSTPSGTFAAPYDSIQFAIDTLDDDLISDCPFVYVRPGYYAESISFQGKPLVIEASIAHQAIIEPNNPGSVVQFTQGEGADSQLIGFDIRGGSGEGTSETSPPGCGGGVLIIDSSPVLLSNSIYSNTATYGAGLCVLGTGAPEVFGNTFEDNVAEMGGGALYLGEQTVAYITGNIMDSNVVTSGNGGGVYCDSMASAGHLNSNRISYNSSAELGGGLFIGDQCFVELNDNTIYGNSALYGGGIAVLPSENTTVAIVGTTISNSTAEAGGGIYVGPGSGGVSVLDSRIETCLANYGGAIYIDASASLTVSNVTLTDNQADANGGGIYVASEARLIYDTGEVSGNRAVNGGGLYADNAFVMVIGNTSDYDLAWLDKTASSRGGALYIEGLFSSTNDSNTITRNTFEGNRASDGGGVASIDSSIRFTYNELVTNVATGDGGGVFCEAGGSKLKVATNIFVQNTPDPQYGCEN